MTYEFIQTRVEGDKVGVITLNRPKQLNALNGELMRELGHALKAFDADDEACASPGTALPIRLDLG